MFLLALLENANVSTGEAPKLLEKAPEVLGKAPQKSDNPIKQH